MNDLLKGAAVIRRAESELRDLLAVAAQGGEYDQLKRLADWAQQLHFLVADEGSWGATVGRGQHGAVHEIPVPFGELGQVASSTVARTAARFVRTRKVGRARRRITAKRKELSSRGGSETPGQQYPFFVRQNESLIKVGWSRQENAPYEHRARRRVVELLVEAVARAGRSGRRFSMDDVLPLNDGNAEIPSYQSYLALAWLRVENLLDQHGRQGYSLRDPVNLRRLVEERWGQLKAR